MEGKDSWIEGKGIPVGSMSCFPFENGVQKIAVALPVVRKPLRKGKERCFFFAGEDHSPGMDRSKVVFFELGITAGDEYDSTGRAAERVANAGAGFLFGFAGNGAGVDDIEVSLLVEMADSGSRFEKSFSYRFGFQLIELAAKRAEGDIEEFHQRMRSVIRFLPSRASASRGLMDSAFS